ncbi:hypothetical protein BDA99DRAFT_61307 [Phascolomyces articulosus]|uniref:E3 ubiquitin protein ligase n=1 Tax=Phascolomyces articulosus TaxID=60185 RepID=A0AAD5KAC2_9FUNG|nr:hypothetical protein BDA99DRAFT_61307 [Phascolomyces articulosus]
MAAREPEEPSSAPRPPKKRFVPSSSSSSSPTRSVDEDNDSSEDAADPLMEPFEDFRRDAIFRQWKEYMRFGKRYKKRKLSTENRQQTNEASLNIWESQFQQLRKALHDLVSDDHAESLKAVKHQRDENNSYQSMLDSITEHAPSMTMAMKKSKSTPITDSEITRSAQSFKSKRQLIAEKIKPLLDPSLQNEYQDALSQWQSGEKMFNKTKDNLELHTIKYLVLAEELQLMTRKLEVLETLTRETRLELANAEHRLVSKKAKISESSSSPTQVPGNDSIDSHPPPLSSPNEPSEKTVTEITPLEQEENTLVQVRRTLGRQLKDIEEMKEERIDLKQKIIQEEIDLISLPASRIDKFSTVYVPEDKLRDYRQESDRLLMECRRIRQDRENLKRSRRAYMQERDIDQLETIQGLQNKLHSLDRELNEVRGQRDALQIIIDEVKHVGTAGRASLPELELIAQTRRDRASILETELLQLHKKCAALSGNRPFYEMAMAIDDNNEITIKPIQHELRTLEETIKELRTQLAGQAEADQQHTLDHDIEKMLETSHLKRKVDEFQEKYGFHVTRSEDDNDVVGKLKETLDSIEVKINDTQKTLKNLESGEIESSSVVAEAFKGSVMLDEQNMTKIMALVKMENDLSRVRTERGKYHQVFNNLNKAKDASKMVVNALNVQKDKEIAYMKELIEHRKNMKDQINNLDREITQSNMALEIYQTKKDEFDETLKDLKERSHLVKDKAVELEKAIMEKIRLTEQGAHERLRIEENSELLRRRIEATTQEERPAETELRNQRDEFRVSCYFFLGLNR